MTRVIVQERIPTATDLPHPLGRHVRHDSESRRYPFRAPWPRRLASVRWQRHIGVLDQGSIGACTGFAGVGCLCTDPYYETLTPSLPWRYTLDHAGALALYSEATKIDDYPGSWPPDDTGSDGGSVAKALTAAEEISGYQWTFSVDDALVALSHGPVITGVPWFMNMFYPDPTTGVVDIGGGLAGGHEFVVDEYDDDRKLVGCTNSWGTGWGLAGRFYLRVQDWATLLDQQGDVTVFVPLTEPAPEPTPVVDPDLAADAAFATALRPWTSRRHIGCNERAAVAARTWLAARGL